MKVSHFSCSSGSIRQHQYGRFTTRRIVDWDEYGVEEWVRQRTWKCLKYLGKSLFLLLQININKHMKHTRGMATKCTHNSSCSVIHQQQQEQMMVLLLIFDGFSSHVTIFYLYSTPPLVVFLSILAIGKKKKQQL